MMAGREPGEALCRLTTALKLLWHKGLKDWVGGGSSVCGTPRTTFEILPNQHNREWEFSRIFTGPRLTFGNFGRAAARIRTRNIAGHITRAAGALVIASTFAGANSRVSAQAATLALRSDEARVDLSARTVADVRALRGRLAQHIHWRPLRAGLSMAEIELSAGALNIPVRAILVKLDPARFTFALQHATKANRVSGAWAIDSADARVAFAVNAGQFKEAGPWGWLRIAGADQGLPGAGALAYAVAFDSAGRVRWLAPRDIAASRRDRTIVHGFQSYPQLLHNGEIPSRARDRKLVDQTHRDARLIMAATDDGQLLFALTRFDALGRRTERVPIGLTLPESIALSSALGARHAIMLDGGVSAQMLVRDSVAQPTAWRGLRMVPVGLVAFPHR